MTACVLTEIDGPIAYVWLNRPESLNGVDLDMVTELAAAADEIRVDRDVRAVVLQGRGRSFCAGLDFGAAFADRRRLARFFVAGPRRVNRLQRMTEVWRTLPVPVIAVVHGHCFGAGVQLAAGADFRFTTPDAVWSILEGEWGLVPDMAGTVPFGELMAVDAVMRLALTGEVVTGRRAVELGLATAAGDDPLALALELVDRIVERSPDSVAATKRLVYESRRGSARRAYRLERRLQSQMFKAPNTTIARRAGQGGEAPTFGPRTFG